MKSQKTFPSFYEIRVAGELAEMWADWFEDLSIRKEMDEEGGRSVTVLYGPIADQPALHGVLNKIRDLNLELLSIQKVKSS